MKILVCVKQVPDTETKIKLSGDSIDKSGIKWIMNPYDELAVEEALKLKSLHPTSEITAITVGPKTRTAEVLRTAIAMGADEGILIDSTDGIDSTSTARALAEAAKKFGPFDFIYTGKIAIDDGAAVVPQMLAEFLGLPHATVISKAEYTGSAVRMEREVEGGSREILEMKFPGILAASKGLNTPRYASLPGIMKAKKKVLKELSLPDLGINSTESKVLVSKFQLPAERPTAKMVTGDAGAQAKEIVRLLREEAKVI